MKAKTKTALIVAVAVVAIGVTLWLVLRGGKKTTDGVIRKLNVSDEIKNLLKQYVAQIEAYQSTNPAESETWSKASIANDAASAGCTVAQMTVVHASYMLVSDGKMNQSDWENLKKMILSL